jgi:hypothetical protein
MVDTLDEGEGCVPRGVAASAIVGKSRREMLDVRLTAYDPKRQ